ncbi:MAG: sigma-54 dependent transcriptional regulator [Polyangiaceae bacterium]
MIGQSAPWRAALADLRAAAVSPRTPVLLTGESGTGKELAAEQVHAWSVRAHRPFVSVNAACLSPALLESELFGHEAGAFTGATSRKAGLFELASGGTLFLDEVGELPLHLQPKLLRVLEGHPFRRVGGERPITADVRLVSATNCRMEEAVSSGRFRLDLYHRLRVVEVVLPPLRERDADAELLAIHFLSRLGAELGRPSLDVTPEAFAAIRAYLWPGNVRELKNAIERAIVLNRTGRIVPGDLPPEVLAGRGSGPPQRGSGPPQRGSGPPQPTRESPYSNLRPAARGGRELGDVVRQHVIEAYRASDGNLARAARSLGIGRATLRRRLKDYGVTLEAPARPRRG